MELCCSSKESNQKSKTELATIITENNHKFMESLVEKVSETISNSTKTSMPSPEKELPRVDKIENLKNIQKKRLMERKFNYWKYYRVKIFT